MDTPDRSDAQRRRVAIAEHLVAAWALAVAAGCVVAVCYAELSHVEVGPMTGNTIATGVSLGAHGSNAVLTRAAAIVAFVFGVAAGVAIAEECARHGVRRVLAATLGLEIALLGAFMWWAIAVGPSVASHWQLDGLVALPALAMGLQTAALRRAGGQTVRTVYISGVVTRAAEEAVRYAYWRRDRRRGATDVPWRNEPTARRLALLAGIFVAYALGAIGGGLLDHRWHLWALFAPLALLTTVSVVDAALDAGPPSR